MYEIFEVQLIQEEKAAASIAVVTYAWCTSCPIFLNLFLFIMLTLCTDCRRASVTLAVRHVVITPPRATWIRATAVIATIRLLVLPWISSD